MSKAAEHSSTSTTAQDDEREPAEVTRDESGNATGAAVFISAEDLAVLGVNPAETDEVVPTVTESGLELESAE